MDEDKCLNSGGDLEKEKQCRIREIKELEHIGNWEICRKKYKKLLKKYPRDYVVLWEYVLFLTSNLNQLNIGLLWEEDIRKAQECVQRALELAPDEFSKNINIKWTAYAEKYNKYLEKKKQEDESRRINKLQEIINGNLQKLDGLCFGTLKSQSSYLYYENKKLYICVRVRNGTYVLEQAPLEKLPCEKFEVFLDQEGYFIQRKRKSFFTTAISEEPLLIEGQPMQLVKMNDYKDAFYSCFCTIKVGEKERTYINYK